jgi:hypothetical protein
MSIVGDFLCVTNYEVPEVFDTPQEDSAALNSDSAEEVAWTPTRGPGPAHTSMPQPPSPFPVVGHETAAAVNLLSMSIHEQDLGIGRGVAGTFAARDLSTSYDHHQVIACPVVLSLGMARFCSIHPTIHMAPII